MPLSKNRIANNKIHTHVYSILLVSVSFSPWKWDKISIWSYAAFSDSPIPRGTASYEETPIIHKKMSRVSQDLVRMCFLVTFITFIDR